MAQPLPPGNKPSLTAGDRDAALDRVGRFRRWALAGAAALVAGFAALASALVPGRSLAAKAPTTSSAGSGNASGPSRTTEPPLPPPAPASQLGLRSPDAAPQPAAPPQSDPAPAPEPDPSQQATPAPQPDPSQQATPAPQPAPSQQSGGGAATSGGS